MAKGLNKVFLLGNVGSDPELKFADDEFPLLKFSLATHYDKKNKNGEWVQEVEWHHVSLRGKRAKPLAALLKKGERIMVEGRIATRSWLDEKGIKKYWTEVLAREICFTGSRRPDSTEHVVIPLTDASSGGRKTGPAVQDSLPV